MERIESEEQILAKYKLSEEEHEMYYQTIKRIYTGGKTPENNPIAVIVGGQTGAGKSGILGYSTKMFDDDNVVIINSDEIKPFHPKSEEIAKLYPDLYTKITDQESNTWTSRLFEELRREKYNIIFEGTMKNNRIADESITELKQIGYTVVVRGLAVCDLQSRLSILERYEGQVATKGWGRLVVPAHHNQTYQGMPETIKYIEENDYYDILEIYARGEVPSEPILVYSNHNKSSSILTQQAIKNRKYVSKFTRKFGFEDAKDAVAGSREEEYDMILPTSRIRLQKVMDSMNNRYASDIEKSMVMDVLNLIEQIIKKKPELSLKQDSINNGGEELNRNLNRTNTLEAYGDR